MTPALSAILLPAASCLALVLLALLVRALRRPRRTGLLEVAPDYRSLFRTLGLVDVKSFLALPGATPHIVSGHPDRHVARVELHEGERSWTAYLKCEPCITLRGRLMSALAGFGFVSRSLREARTLQALQREGGPGPEWLAAGEDASGRAFLLVRGVAGVELRALLRDEKDRSRRRRIAHNLGATLARLHAAGFLHPDLYANHLFVDPESDSVAVLDWQRARLKPLLSWPQRRRDLAALHATLDEALATPRERLVFLRAYRRASPELDVSGQRAAHGIDSEARRLLLRRHVREKRQPPAPAQAWICLNGETLCVTPAMQERCAGAVPDWLENEELSQSAEVGAFRHWPRWVGETRPLLVRRHECPSLADWGRRLRGRAFVPTSQRHAALLLRLQRHGVPVPEPLALGQRRGPRGVIDSFLLTEPSADTCSLEAWLARRTRRRLSRAGQARLRLVLRRAGELLHRLHAACCYLDTGPAGCGLSVRQTGDEWDVVLDRPEAIRPSRRRRPRRAARDVRRVQQILRTVGCSRSDLCRFRAGYRPLAPSALAARPITRGRGAARMPAPSDSFWRRLVRGVRRLCQRPEWPRFAGPNWADRIMEVDVTDRFHAKQGRSTGRWILPAPTEDGPRARPLSVYLKRHHQLPWWQGWCATLWPRPGWSPAVQEWRNLEWAGRLGVPVPRAAAAGEYVGPWGKLCSFLAVEELAGMISLQEAIPLAAVRQDGPSLRRWKRSLAAEMARLTRLLHDRHCFHKDLYLCHFFIARADTAGLPPDGWRGRVHLIDLHRLAHHPLSWWFWQTKDLAQLLYSSEIIGVDARDRLAFWRAYRGTGPSRPACPWVRRAILYRWMRYRHHNARSEQNGQTGRAAA